MKSRPALSFLIGFFILLFLADIALVAYQEKKYEKQIKWITECNAHPKISELKFTDFSFDKTREVVYKDSIEIDSLMASLCKSQTINVLHREGRLESCKMRITFDKEIVVLSLIKDNYAFTL